MRVLKNRTPRGREILDTARGELYATKRSQIMNRVLPEALRFSTANIVHIFQPTPLLWLGKRIASLLIAVELLRMRERRRAYSDLIAGILGIPDTEKLNAPRRNSRLTNGEIFPLASH